MISEPSQQHLWTSRQTPLPVADAEGNRRLRIRIPGSTANLGPGFDTLALALNLHCTLDVQLRTADRATGPEIICKGQLLKAAPLLTDNLIYKVLNQLWHKTPELLQRISITVDSQIPLGKGCGSSAAAIVGAVWAAQALTDTVANDNSILKAAQIFEGHADNISASLLGGLVVSANNNKTVTTQQLAWPHRWCPLVVVPGYALSTEKARAILPDTVKHKDAVHNVQKVALFLAAVVNEDEKALREALHDRLHEPYRAVLVPELEQLRELLVDLPILGCVLSGAGSSVLVIVDKQYKQQVLEHLKAWCNGCLEGTQVVDPGVNYDGLQVNYD